MAYVVTDSCVRCKFTDCVEACPVDCFHEAPHMLVIDPEECIDCGACVDDCPVEAIFLDEDVPNHLQEYIALNAKLALETPIIMFPKEAHPEAEKYRAVTGKINLI
jgi:ferredoxin